MFTLGGNMISLITNEIRADGALRDGALRES